MSLTIICAYKIPAAASPVVVHTALMHKYDVTMGFNVWQVSRDGKYIAFDHQICSTEDGLRPVVTLPKGRDNIRSIAWSPHSHRIVYCCNNAVYMYSFVRPGLNWTLTTWRTSWTQACFTPDSKYLMGFMADASGSLNANGLPKNDNIEIYRIVGAAAHREVAVRVPRYEFGGLCGGTDAVLVPYKQNSVISLPDRAIVYASGTVTNCPRALTFTGPIFDLNAGLVDHRWFIHALQVTAAVGPDLIQQWQYTKLFLQSLDGRNLLPLGWNRRECILQFGVTRNCRLWVELDTRANNEGRSVQLREYKIVGLHQVDQLVR